MFLRLYFYACDHLHIGYISPGFSNGYETNIQQIMFCQIMPYAAAPKIASILHERGQDDWLQ